MWDVANGHTGGQCGASLTWTATTEGLPGETLEPQAAVKVQAPVLYPDGTVITGGVQ